MMPTFFLGPFEMYENETKERDFGYIFIYNKKNNSEVIIIINDVLTFIY